MSLFKKNSKENKKTEAAPLAVRQTRTLIGPEKLADSREFEVLPIRVDAFDRLVSSNGIERGSIVLVAGGAGTGKTTFCFQSLFESAKAREKYVYLSFY